MDIGDSKQILFFNEARIIHSYRICIDKWFELDIDIDRQVDFFEKNGNRDPFGICTIKYCWDYVA